MQKASILGFGTDLGGSIRMPACLTGVYGLKPSVSSASNRVLDE